MAKKKTGTKGQADKEKDKIEPGKVDKPEDKVDKPEPEKTELDKPAEEKTEPDKPKEKSTKDLLDEACKKLGISKDSVAKVVRDGNDIVIELKPPNSSKIHYTA